MERRCATPGCTFKDGHPLACSFELGAAKRIHTVTVEAPERPSRPGNQFQLGLEFSRMCMKGQAGVTLSLPPDLNPVNNGTFKSRVLYASTGKNCVLTSITNEGIIIDLKAKDLTRDDVKVSWNKLSGDIMRKHRSTLSTESDEASARRAHLFAKTLVDNYRTSSDQMIITLDGKGSNRKHMQETFAERKLHKDQIPQIKTFEIDPDVALSQQLLYGKKAVVFTGALAAQKFGYGCEPASRPRDPPGIEYLITHRKNAAGVQNTLITAHDCERVVGLNLDYCGGVMGGLDFERANRVLEDTLARLPHIVVLCITIGKRRRQGLEYNFEKYAPTPYGFAVVHTFDSDDDNKRVISRIYVRNFCLPRTLEVPGTMWSWEGWKGANAANLAHKWKSVLKGFTTPEEFPIMYCYESDEDYQVFKPNKLTGKNVTYDDLIKWKQPNPREIIHKRKERTHLVELGALITQKQRKHEQEMSILTTVYETMKAEAAKKKPKLLGRIQKKKVYLCRKCGKPKKGHRCAP